ncbi:asparagine synthase (glutamine-hydrolyzing) [Alkaliphilus peptidifermentans]|uniref:asparagine synthase (glutamine-hydrolyzing) n=1 Tax=Alkaliphilus peptidifermentans DSM 18978 TaxID=1120976 RepID=A0A1G5FG50_9FIRM|nr:asparagine synthase (glutamine-hydrolyzing) [Alkaliphilus peptidifermentans]SCY38183.1 asparagine synthase (glutamine-hydrolysing) [Alkaliphilus peptidifermentans DSM 18978]
MCGICGFADQLQLEEKHQVIEKMMDKIIHRGPDEGGKYVDEGISLGFRRLSIIDLEEGRQPIFNEDESLVLIFNGEIYNYMDVKEDLIEKGHKFRTKTDSEVILHSYEEYGTEMFKHLRGMFAFVIWNKADNSLFGARDFFGIKPFYYGNMNGSFIFGSEIKSIIEHPAITKKVNLTALQSYLTFQYSPLQETFFQGVYKLPPAHYIIYKEGKVEVNRYWQAEFDNDGPVRPFEEVVQEVEEIVQDSIKAHMVSDVEVGSFLSSGIDSSYVAASFNGDKTFTVGFDYANYNEVDEATELAKQIGIDYYSKIITPEEYWEAISKVQYHMDEPLADPSCVALYFVSQLASQQVKVVLSGEGADELFGGYRIYQEPLSLKPLTNLPKFLRSALGGMASMLPFDIKGKNFFIRGSKDVRQRFIGNAYMFTEEERSKLMLKGDFKQYSPTDITGPFYDQVADKDDTTKMQFLDLNMWLTGDILLKADKMSMAHSLELRVPYLDKEVWKVASQLPLEYRVNKTTTKYALRRAAVKKLPQEVASRRKLGFPVPIRVWLREEKYFHTVKQAFTSEAAKSFFNIDELVKLLEEHFNGKKDNSRKIWTIYMFLVWHKEYFEGTEIAVSIEENESSAS